MTWWRNLADIKDFFMIGKHNDLSARGSLVAEASSRKGVVKLVPSILKTQYIRIRDRKGTWRAISGTGMGSRVRVNFLIFVAITYLKILCLRCEIRGNTMFSFTVGSRMTF